MGVYGRVRARCDAPWPTARSGRKPSTLATSSTPPPRPGDVPGRAVGAGGRVPPRRPEPGPVPCGATLAVAMPPLSVTVWAGVNAAPPLAANDTGNATTRSRASRRQWPRRPGAIVTTGPALGWVTTDVTQPMEARFGGLPRRVRDHGVRRRRVGQDEVRVRDERAAGDRRRARAGDQRTGTARRLGEDRRVVGGEIDRALRRRGLDADVVARRGAAPQRRQWLRPAAPPELAHQVPAERDHTTPTTGTPSAAGPAAASCSRARRQRRPGRGRASSAPSPPGAATSAKPPASACHAARFTAASPASASARDHPDSVGEMIACETRH